MTINRTSIFAAALILLAGLIPVTIYLMEGGSLTAEVASLPTRSLPLREQAAQALAGLVVKPTYMMLSLGIIVALLGHPRTPVRALQYGQIAFLAGEVFCAVNFYIYRHESILSEYLHSYGMAMGFGFTFYALLEGWEGKRPAGNKLRFITLPLAALAFLPLLSPLQTDAYAANIFNFPYSYLRLEVYQLNERRVLPLLALIAFGIAFFSIRQRHESFSFSSKFFLCAGAGALGFSFFRVALNILFAETLVWFEFWEETAELIFVGAIARMLWRNRREWIEDGIGWIR
ncbi:MAG: hypothetical protein IT314_05085 [Anaerolineales bacterium]|nr:hypothetical protein [Anaerolineales bacterium]